MTTEKLVNEVLFGKTELKSEKVELALLDTIESDVLANGKSKDIARASIREAFTNVATAVQQYSNVKNRQDNIKKNSDKFKTSIKELGIEVTDQFQKNILADLYIDKEVDNILKALQSASSSLKVSGEV
jgi:hypothetical protein